MRCLVIYVFCAATLSRYGGSASPLRSSDDSVHAESDAVGEKLDRICDTTVDLLESMSARLLGQMSNEMTKRFFAYLINAVELCGAMEESSDNLFAWHLHQDPRVPKVSSFAPTDDSSIPTSSGGQWRHRIGG